MWRKELLIWKLAEAKEPEDRDQQGAGTIDGRTRLESAEKTRIKLGLDAQLSGSIKSCSH